MKRSWIISLALLLLLAGGSYLTFLALQPTPLPPGFVYGNGHIEGVEVRLASEVSGRVIEHSLIEGETIIEGQTLVVIDAQSFRDELAAMRGEQAALESALAVIDSQIDTWAHHAESAERQVQRLRQLVETEAASQLALDSALDAEREAQGQLLSLRAQRQQFAARVESAQSRVRMAETQVQRSTIVAPQDATVLVRAIETGEVIRAGQPLALLVDLTRLELKIYLSGTDAGKLQQGDPARVRVDGFPDRLFEARVTRLDAYAQFTPRDIHLPEERTRMVYGVVLALGNQGFALRPGMSADAWIRWDDGQEWPAQLAVPRG